MDNLDQRQSTVIPSERSPVPVVRNPSQYLANFLNSEEYKDAYTGFFEGKTINPQVTEEQKLKSFLNYGDIETPLNHFYDHKMKLAYDGSFYTPEISNLWREYTLTIKKLKTIQYDRDGRAAHDAVRSAIHTKTAEAMVLEGIVPNVKIGRKILQFMTITSGLEDSSIKDLKEADRRNYAYGGKMSKRAV